MMVLKHPLVLLLAVSSLASCRLVNNFLDNNNGCPQFFLSDQSPSILQDGNNVDRYKQICQEYLNKDRFATLYDTKNRIPVYSAYLHIPHEQIGRIDEWWTEPKLSNAHQATNRDYKDSAYDRGHLYPVYNNNDAEAVDATFTLTNAAPQSRGFNVQWSITERKVNQIMRVNCGGTLGYIVTGVVPDPKLIINNRVQVADYFWTAYCCQNNRNVKGAFLMDRKGVLLLDNDPNIQSLENHLSNLYHQNFQVFGGHC